MKLEIVSDASTLAKTTWVPSAPVTIHHAALDSLYTDGHCANRVAGAIALGATCLWQQIGVMNAEADRLAREAGMDSVMDRCVKIEHARIFGGLHWAGVNTRVISARRPL